VNGAVVDEALLTDGDRVAFGDVQAIFQGYGAAPTAAMAAVAEPVYVPAAPVVGIPQHAPKPAARMPRPQVSRPRRVSHSNSSEGCFNVAATIGLFLLAFVIGLTVRHYKETDRFLLNDIGDKVFKQIGRIELKRADEP
jgi:hypothetical protein